MTRQSSGPPTSTSRGLRYRRLTAATVGALVVGVGVLSPAPALAAGATLYVGQGAGCSDAGPGTTATAPFCTIGAAVKAAATGDTVSVAPGTYAERVDVSKTLNIVGQTGATVDATGRLYGFALSAAGVQLSGFTVQGASTAGVFLNQVMGTTVRNLRTTGGGNGIFVLGGSGNTLDQVAVSGGSTVGILLRTTSQNTVSSSTTQGNRNHGLSIQGGDGNVVSGVTSTGNSKGDRSATGIDVRGFTSSASGLVRATHTIVEANTTYGNEDSGIEIYPDSSDTTVRRNVTYDNGDHGIDVAGAPNTTIVSNTIVGNTNVGLNVEASGAGVASSGAILRDNISAENGINPSVNPTTGASGSPGEIRVDTASTSGTTMDRDLVWRAAGGQLFQFGGTFSSSLAGVQALGQELHGINADPKFVSASDFHLTIASPAVDAAFADVPGWRDADRDGNAPVDQASVANTGTGTPPFADIGAYELTGGTPPPPPPPSPPTASLTATPNPATTNSPVTLDASGSRATATGASLTAYTFDCGDKSVTPVPDQSSAAKASCTYTTAATYNPAVTVTDSNKQTATATAKVTVNTPPATAPTAKLTATPAQLTTGGTTTLDASGSAATTQNATLTGYAFTCGDGSAATSTGKTTATCTYAKAGNYTASVTVTDSNKQTASDTATVTVTDATTGGGGGGGGGGGTPPPPPSPTAPAAHLTATPAQVVAGGTSTLDGSGSTATASGASLTGYRFDCGNGATTVTGTATSTRCSYPNAGSYTATLTVTDSNGKTDSAAATVTVTAPAPAPAPPHARLSLVMKRLAHGHLRVRLDASASTGSPGAPLVAFKFYCGNGHHTDWIQRTSTACVYRHHGRYLVRVKVKNSLGMVDTVTRVVRFRRQ